MERDEQKKREEELDRFWDIDALIPPKRAPHYAADTETTEIVLEPQGKEQTVTRTEPIPPAEAPERHFIPPHTAEELRQAPSPDEEYTPDNALIRKVRLYRWRSNYRYYEGFVRDAVRLYPVRGAECPRVPFFSYVPQYSQMSRQQLEWYLWWRDSLRHGKYLDTDYSYVLLYVYELINLSGKLDPATAQEALCNVWAHYRKLYHQLDSYLPEWICDHSLIHRLPPPAACTGDLLSVVMSHCALKEFYVPGGGEDGYIRALLAFCSNYDYRKSKFCTGENVALFERTVEGALREVTRQVSENGKLFSAAGMDDSRLTRDAYTGALCSYRIKRKIEVEYCSFSRSHELRYFVTDVVKYTENRLRAHLGIRSRLTVYALSVPIRNLLDAYLDSVLPARTATSAKKREEVAAYEKLYDLPKQELSLQGAAEIERQSWETTQRLVEAFESELEPMSPPPAPEPVPKVLSDFAPIPTVDTDGEDVLANALTSYLPFLRAAMEGDRAGQIAFAKKVGKLTEVVADEINDLAAEHMGDILLEETDEIYTVMEDYRDVAEKILNEIGK